MKRLTLPFLAVLLLFGGIFLVASCDPNAPASPTGVEIDIDHHHPRPHTKAPSYRKPPAAPRRLTKRR